MNYFCASEIVPLLIQAGVHINTTDEERKTPLDVAKSDRMRKLLRTYGARKSAEIKKATEELHELLVKKAFKIEKMQKCLAQGADINAKQRSDSKQPSKLGANAGRGTTLLHIAVKQGHFEATKLLIKKGAKIMPMILGIRHRYNMLANKR